MKKKLLIFLGIFIFMIIPKNVLALEYQVNGTTYTVDSPLTFLHYCYYKYPPLDNVNNGYFVALYNNTNIRCAVRLNSSDIYAWSSQYNSGLTSTINDIFFTVVNFSNGYPDTSNFIYSDNFNFNYSVSLNNSVLYSTINIPPFSTNGISINSNISIEDITNYYSQSNYTITYYLNNEVYREIEVEEGSSHTLIDYTPQENYTWSGWSYDSNIDLTNITSNVEIRGTSVPKPIYTITYYLNNEVYREISIVEGNSHSLLYYEPSFEYNFSGWSYDSNIDLTNITSNVEIRGITSLKPYYTITYYLNEQIYDTVSVIEGTNYILANYVPPRNYTFSGWSYDSNIDLTNINQNVDIFGTTTYVRPTMNYSENINSIIHNISYQILGDSIPVEFDFLYTIMDFIILLIIILCVLAPFIILIKLLGGRF